MSAVVCTAAFGENGPVLPTEEAVFRHAEFEHEQAVLVLDRTDRVATRYLSTGAPVVASWGSPAKPLAPFFGYVSHTKPVYKQGEGIKASQQLAVYCVAATYAFKGGDYYARRSVTADQPVRELAERYRFDVQHVDHHRQVWSLLAQAGRSDWAFMVECAKRMGWALYAHGTRLFCHDRADALAMTRHVPVFSSTQASLNGRLRLFTSNVGQTSPTGGLLAARFAYGVNPRTETVLHHTNRGDSTPALMGAERSAPVFGYGQTDLVVDSLSEAYDRLQGEEIGNRLTNEATLHGGGDQSVKVGRAVQVRGLSEAENGPWYVKAYTQTLRPSEFLLEASLGRDSGMGGQMPIYRAPGPNRGSRLVNGQWVVG